MSVGAASPPTRIGLDVAPVREVPAGVGIYVSELASALDTLEGERVVRLGARPGSAVQRPAGPRRGETTMRGRLHLAWLLRAADREARRAGCGLVHYTNAVAPLRTTVPFVLTIHDLSVIRLPGSHPTLRLAVVPVMLAAAHRARRIIVPSAATGDEARRLLHLPPDRIAVVPHAARRALTEPGDEAVLARLGLRAGEYVLALGTIEPRKNHLRLLRAFERVAELKPDLQLVHVGAAGWRDGAFRRALRRSVARDRVRLAGRQPDAALARLLGSAAALAYPSVYEGFGLPVVEAMAAGTPVVTSRRSSMREVGGEAAVLVDPMDTASIADGLLEALERHDELAAAGRARVDHRSWLDVARETLDVYGDAIGRSA